MTDDPQALIAELEVVHDLGKKLDAGDGGVWGMAGRAAKLLKQQQDKIAALEAALTEAPADFDGQAMWARKVLGMADDEPNAATGFDTREAFARLVALTEAPADCYGPGTDQCVIRSDFTVQHNHRAPTPASTDARETLRQAIAGYDVLASRDDGLLDAILAALPVTRDDAKAEALEEYADELAERGGPINEVWASSVRARAATYRATSQKGDGQ